VGKKDLVGFKGMRRRILATVVLLFLLTLAAVVGGVVSIARSGAWGFYEKSLIHSLKALAGELECRGLDQAGLQRLFHRLEKEAGSAYRYYVVGQADKILFATPGSIDPERLLQQGRKLVSNRSEGLRREASMGRHRGLLAAVRLPQQAWLVLFLDAEQLRRMRRRGALLIAGILALGLLGVALTLTRQIITPLLQGFRQLTEAIRRYAAGEKGFTPPRLSGGVGTEEFGEIFAEFNRMAETIDRLEEQRRQQEEKERVLLAQLAHDINTPMAILRAHAENLVEFAETLPEKRRRKPHTEILAQSVYIQALVDDLLTLASARTAALTCQPEPVLLDELFDAIVDTFQPLVAADGVVILAEGKGLTAWADPLRTRQILTNLVKNAVIHGRDDLSLVEISAASHSPEEVVITVRDDGPGIAAAELETIFEPFARGRDRRERGWGLGLTIVRMLARLQGGDCRCRNPGRGALFEVRLPARAPVIGLAAVLRN